MSTTTSILFWDVDTQVDFMRPDGKLYVPDAEQIAPNLRRLTEAAAEHAIPVIASADDHEPTDPEISDDPDFEETYPPHCMRGTPGVERIPETQQAWTFEVRHAPLTQAELERAAAAERPVILIHKKRFDVFTNPNTEPLVRALNPERIVVYGVALDVCNWFAIEGLLARGLGELTLVTDATKPIHADRAEELLASWRSRGVELTTTEAVLRVVASEPATA
ncbi:MAG: cysteine hydrolase family protein [Thermoanaerobaculia bacterium]